MSELTIDRINISYSGNTLAVSDFSLAAVGGTAKIIAGAAGSGKSSILRAVAGLVKYSGNIVFDGSNLIDIKIKDRNFVYASFDSPLFESKTVRYNLAYGSLLRKADKSKIDLSIEEVSSHFCITDYLDAKVTNIPNYVRHNVIFARAFIRDASVYLINEPTRGLNEEEAQNLIDRLDSIYKTKNAVMLLSISDYSMIRNLDYAVVILKDGKKVCENDMQTLSISPPDVYSALYTAERITNIYPAAMEKSTLTLKLSGDREYVINLDAYELIHLEDKALQKNVIVGCVLSQNTLNSPRQDFLENYLIIKRLLIFNETTQKLISVFEKNT